MRIRVKTYEKKYYETVIQECYTADGVIRSYVTVDDEGVIRVVSPGDILELEND